MLPIASAHGDLHERIKAVTLEIQQMPDSAFLYYKRGVLYSQHEEYQNAFDDLLNAKALGYEDYKLTYSLAATLWAMESPEEGLDYIDHLLVDHPSHVKSHRLRGLILFDLKQYEAAGIAFDQVIQLANATLPENYLEAAHAWERMGDLDQAIARLESGLEELGNIPSLESQVIALHLRSGDFNSVLYYQNQKLKDARRKEFVYFDRAATFIEMENYALAKADLSLALKAIDQLSPRTKNLSSTRRLIKEINQSLLLINPFE